MSKEALNKLRDCKSFYGEDGFSLYGEFGETKCAEFAQSFADQEKEKVAVAFAEWKDSDTILMDGKHRIMKTIKSSVYGVSFDNNSDLYQYFINNVYNK